MRAITFRSFRLDLRAGRLMRGNEAVALRPKTWSVLLYLAERPGGLVSKSELLDAIWPDVAVTESVLSKSIGELRTALGDSFKAPCIIETVPRRGFRFIAPVGDPVSGTTVAGVASDPVDDRRSVVSERAPQSSSFVGRANELGKLNESIAKSHAGERRVVFITGTAGIGKTTVLETFLDSPAVRDATGPVWIARGACVEQHGPGEAYMPVIEALERLARRRDAGRLIGLLRRVAPTWLAQMPWLIEGEDEHALRWSLQDVRPERMLREFAALIEALTTEVTLVLALEDLQWSDASTVDLLSLLAQRHEPARLLVVGTLRVADAIVSHHGLMKAVRRLSVRRQCVELPLSDLSEAEVYRYLERRFAGADFLPDLAQLICRRTDGNPLFMIGVVDHMLSRGHILHTAPGWALSAPLGELDLGVPDDVRLLIENDLYDLSPADRALFQAASVAGEDFSALVVAATLGGEAADVEMRCEGFARAQRFLRLAGHVELPDGGVVRRYAFAHELYRQAVYDQISEGQRIRLHQRVGQELEAAYGARQMEIASRLAIHFERGRDDKRALYYLTAVAARVRLRFASREAMGYLEAALVVLARLPEDDERRRRELELRLSLGSVCADIHGFASEQVRETYERAAELCAAVGSQGQLAGVMYARWYLHALRGERDEAITVAAELENLAEEHGTVQQRVVAASVGVRTATFDGRFTEATSIMRRRLTRQSAAKTLAAPAFGPDPAMVGTMHYALSLWFLGDPGRAQTTMRAVLSKARGLGHFFTLAAVLIQAALIELLGRDAVAGRALAEETEALSAEHGFAFWGAVASILTGWASVQQGDAVRGSAAIAAALAKMQATGARYFLAFGYAFLAEGHLRGGAHADGLAAADAGLTLAESSLDRAYVPELWRLKGELLLEQSRREGDDSEARRARAGQSKIDTEAQAEECFRRGLELAQTMQAKSLELRTATSLARVWGERGRREDARQLLGGVCGWFSAKTRSVDLDDARALLGRLAKA